MATIGTCLILSIRKEHAQRIFEGSKIFELRKRLPSTSFKRVYLYETGGAGIVGCFDPKRVIKDQKGLLWDEVNFHATTRQRFEQYFERYSDGFAIEVDKPVRFKKAVPAAELRKVNPKFHAPMSSVTIQLSSPLGQYLERRRRLDRKRRSVQVSLVAIENSQREQYKSLIEKHIKPRYEGIDETFGSRTLEIHDLGHDPAGFFTERKEVFSIWDRKLRVGFTTLTWKNNGCAKTGPTLIETENQQKGYGRATRIAIEALVRSKGYRKIYCTCADNASEVAAYLLDSGMKIEAHLDRQYSADHGEFVFGKFLVADEYESTHVPKRNSQPAVVLQNAELTPLVLSAVFKRLFSESWLPVDQTFSDRIVKSGISKSRPDPRNKANRLVCIGNGGDVLGLTVLLPKRGGAVKALLATGTENEQALTDMIEEVCRLSCGWGSRKIYYLQPLLDVVPIRMLKKAQFQMEGFLRAPYKRGQDVGIFSRFC